MKHPARSTGATAARKRLLALQQNVYRALKREAAEALGEPPASLKRYEREYLKDFAGLSRSSRLKALTRRELVSQIRSADVTFIGDFHSFQQSQRTALRLMRDSVRKNELWRLGLELVPSQYQEALDRHHEGRLSLPQLLKEIQYDEHWGFPWAHYAPIFEWAKAANVRLLALNRPKETLWKSSRDWKSTSAELHQRDQWAAGVITDFFLETEKQGRRARVWTLYGDHHVSRNHLPKHLEAVSERALGRKLRSISIHQNYDELYWKLAERGREMHTQAIQLSQGSYCVISGTPWGKLQSLMTWLEGEADEYLETQGDYLSLMQLYCGVVAEFLGVPQPNLGSLTVKTVDEADYFQRARESVSSRELRGLIQTWVSENRRFYVPESQLAYLGAPNPNAAAELAAIFLFHSAMRTAGASPMRTPAFARSTEDFYLWVVECAFGYFGSLLINPRRKCELIADHEAAVARLRRGPELAARKIALKLLQDEEPLPPSAMRTQDLATLAQGARFVGQILAKTIYRAVAEGKISIPELKTAFFSKPAFEESYGALLELYSRFPLTHSKAELI